MANIKLNLDYPIYEGIGITFKAPCDCTGASGLKICHLGGEQVFTFRDSHNNNLAGVGNVFVKGAFVKVVLDIAGSNAYIQNADNNAYLHKTIRWGECDGSIEVGETAKAVTPDSVAVGTNNVSGCKGYYISAINPTTKCIYLTKEKTAAPVIVSDDSYFDTTFGNPGYKPGNEFSIINGKHYAFCGSIAGVIKNKVVYKDALPFSSIEESNGAADYADGTWVFSNDTEDAWIDCIPNQWCDTVTLRFPRGFTSNGQEFSTISFYIGDTPYRIRYDDVDVYDEDSVPMYYETGYRTVVIPEGTRWDEIIVEGDNDDESEYHQDIVADIKTWFNTNATHQATSLDNKNHIFFVPIQADIGSIEDVFFGTVVLGRDNVGAGANGFVAGYENLLSGNYGFIAGHNNKGGHACDITGEDNTDKGNNNHIEGAQNEATGDFVHVEGKGNVGAGDVQHIEGKYNAPDETSARIVGGGSSDADRRNIETLDWLGNLWVRGKVYVGGNDISEATALALASDLGLEIVTGSYTGAGSKYTKTLTFDVKPSLVIITPCTSGSVTTAPAILIRPSTSFNINNANIVPVEWTDDSVILGENLSTTPDNIYDKSGVKYAYTALGYAN